MERLPNEFLGELHRRLGGIVAKIENGGLEYNYVVSALQLVSEGRVQLNKPTTILTVIGNTIRRIKPTYPEWVEEVLHPELEGTGPAEFDLNTVERWLHYDQKNDGLVEGQKIYEYLKNNKMLESCLGLGDLIPIQAKGSYFFQNHFGRELVFGWKSVVLHKEGHLLVPFLQENNGKVFLRWKWVAGKYPNFCPALRFAS